MGIYDPSDEVCPHCGSRGKCIQYATYERDVLDYDREQKKVLCNRITVNRVLCESCSTKEHKVTHAVLSDAIVPYSSYSLLFILTVLYYRLCLGAKLRDICEKFEIHTVQIYRWENLLKEHMREWLGVLKALEQSPKAFLLEILNLENYSEKFSVCFLRKASRSFLQNHINPANCRYPKFAPS